ncbi:MAG: four helix bundle protein [Candidatus Marinimicrobia bacterium]|nr:four helix bundle protein [Candidatus Neomarinimicrobiota bacterium]MCF7850437.1 four helix bundle protein [Candidatus Neomarinimicrobiota bacterium]MCF7904569.1 four helix bundle protein [Candidatus Neomarinimicrobiota bacterium]
MAKVQRFEELRIWIEARALVNEVYSGLETSDKGSKDWGFRSQIQQAAISIMNNIAEGFERNSDKDFARFLDMAKASCGEVRSMLYLAEDQQYLESRMASELRTKSEHISKGIATLAKHLRSS